MEQARLLIAIVFSLLVFFAWEVLFVPKKPVEETKPPVETQEVQKSPEVKEESLPPTVETQPTPEIMPSDPGREPKNILIDTHLFSLVISEKGGAFQSMTLKKYNETAAENSPLKQLIDQNEHLGTVLTGFSKHFPDLDRAIFSVNTSSDIVNVENHPQSVVFTWTSPTGIVVEKMFTFKPDSYLIDLSVTVRNASANDFEDQLTVALVDKIDTSKAARYSFTGPSALMNNHLEQIKSKKIAEQDTYNGSIKWVGLEKRYFMSGIILKNAMEAGFKLAKKGSDIIVTRYVHPSTTIAPGSSQRFDFDLFFGPKSHKLLRGYNNELVRVIDFGWFDFIAKPCLMLMNYLYKVLPNYGIAIIILTTLIKLILWPLGNKSYKSMSEMKRLQPLMTEIREKYKDDKPKMNEELMNLYRTYKVNPMGGCLPMLVQIPVFLALYRMLYEAIELRHAPFFGWIDDLSAPDRLFDFGFKIPLMEPPYGIPVLTIIMGATMLLQQKMSPPPGDPTQAKMMMLMPIVFTFIFINFPSGLVLYWLVNNILSLVQQYYVSKKTA